MSNLNADFVSYPLVGNRYLHYKGGTYEVITLAVHTETKENLVICKSVLFGSIYARPVSMFFDYVENSKGQKVQRFTPL